MHRLSAQTVYKTPLWTLNQSSSCLFYCPSTHSPVRPSARLSTSPSDFPSVHASVRPRIRPSVQSSTHPSNREFVNPSISPVIAPADTGPFVGPSIRQFVRTFVYPTVCSSVYPTSVRPSKSNIRRAHIGPCSFQFHVRF